MDPLTIDDLPKSRRSSRLKFPPLAFWTGQRVFVDPRTNVTTVMKGNDNAIPTDMFYFEAADDTIGSSGDGSHGVTNLDQLGRSSSQATSASSLPNSVKLQQQQQQQQQQQHRSRLPPPSKIPSSAVEMPGSVNSSQLDVQFGNWDNPTTVADSFTADSMPSSLYSGTSSINMTSSSTVQHVPNNAKISTLSEMSSTSLKSQADQQQQQQQSQQHQVSMLMDNHGIGSVSQLSSKTTYPKNEYNAYLASNTEVKDLGNAKVLSPSQSMSFACSQGVDKKHPAQQQVQTSTTSQLTFNQQLPYSADSSSLVYRASSTGVENMSGFTQPSLSQGSLVAPQYGTSSLGYDATSSLTHPMYTVTQGQTQFPYQRFSQNFSATTTQAPYSVGGQSQQQQSVPTGSSMSMKQETGTSYPSSLSQGYDSSGINPYQGMAYQQQQQHAGVGSGYQTGIPDSLQQRNPSQSSSSNFGVGSSSTNPNPSSGKILDSPSKLSVSDSTSSQSITQYDSLPTVTSALTSTPASSTQSATVAQSSLPAASKVVTTAASSKSTAPVTSNKTVVNLPPGVAAPLVNPNYMIGQPPGFHMTAYEMLSSRIHPEPHKLDLMAQNSSLKVKLARAEKELQDSDEKLTTAQSLINELQSRLNDKTIELTELRTRLACSAPSSPKRSLSNSFKDKTIEREKTIERLKRKRQMLILPGGRMSGAGPRMGGYDSENQRSCVLMVYGLNKKMNCQRLFNLFCLYGNVGKIIFLKSKEGSAMVQMSNKDGCEQVIHMLSGCSFFGQKVIISYSKQEHISEDDAPYALSDGTLSYQDFTTSQNNRFSTPALAVKNRILPPQHRLHFFNAPPGVAKDALKKAFVDVDVSPPISFTMITPKSEASSRGFLNFEDSVSCTEALICANHTKLPNPNGVAPYILKLAFSLPQANN